MSATLDLSGLDKRMGQIKNLNKLDATTLMFTWMKIIEEDNRKGVLQGLDKDGVPMRPVTYRPKLPLPEQFSSRMTAIRVGRSTKSESKWRKQTRTQFRLGQKANLRRGMFAGLGPSIAGINNNLSTAEYQLLGGPPLAPRDQFSRVITNLVTTFGSPAHGAPYWFAEGAWDEVVDIKNRPFLKYHFEGIGVKRRDLRGVRPSGMKKAVEALRNWARDAIRTHFK